VKNLAIIGGGSWGTALALVLARRFERIALWVYEADLAARMRESRVNDVYLDGFELPQHIRVTADLPEALSGAAIVLCVVPSHLVRGLYQQIELHLQDGALLVSATKGLENNTLLRMSQILGGRAAVLSGPSFAKEVARGEPTAIVAASEDLATAEQVQAALSGPTFRVYTSTDPTGVEIGGAIKNVIALGAGVLHGLGLGNNAMAALITRGLAEMTRLAVAMGGMRPTLAGLAGLGDLVLTCTGELSRNRMVGIELARGRSLEEITGSMKMVAEGVKTTAAAVGLSKRYSVEMPIVQQMSELLQGITAPRDAIQRLMERPLRNE
jgi:glycerol-3-phosphate dehydrogenase (NAD(P)+)